MEFKWKFAYLWTGDDRGFATPAIAGLWEREHKELTLMMVIFCWGFGIEITFKKKKK